METKLKYAKHIKEKLNVTAINLKEHMFTKTKREMVFIQNSK